MNWKTLDLNLLRVLDAMLRERSTTRVASLVGLSQPAVSAALNRLRHVLSDPLFVREGTRMVPTPFAESIEQPLREALDGIERTLSGNVAFDPARSTRVFRFAGNNHLSGVLLGLITLLADQAPGVRFQLLTTNPGVVARQLAEGEIDLAFTRVLGDPPGWVDHAPAFRGSAAVVASKRNQRLAAAGIREYGKIPLDLFCEMPHVLYSPTGDFGSLEDAALEGIGRRRRIVLTVPDFFCVGWVVARTQFLGLIPAWLARSIADDLGLAVYALPFAVPLIPHRLYWHRRHTADAEHRWMRERILELLRPLDVDRRLVAPSGRGARSPAAPIGGGDNELTAEAP